jgi:serine/threonine-protein kinase
MAPEGIASRLRRARLVRVVVAYLAASWLLLQVTSLFVNELGLPRWFVPAAVVLLAIGFLILLATAWVQSHPATPARAIREEVPGAWEIDLGDVRESVTRGRLPHLTWGRALLGGAVAFALLFGLAGLAALLRDGTSPLGPDPAIAGPEPGLAVLPFRVVGDDAGLWREGMVDLLSANLDGAVGVRTIAPRTVISRWRSAFVDDAEPADAEALDVARDVGARHALLGSMVALGGEVRLSARVHDLSTGRLEGEVQVRGDPDSVPALVDRLSLEVLRATPLAQPGRTPPDVRSITTSSLDALKAYLAGEQLFRRARWEEARVEFTKAVEADSTFALALARLGTTMGWLAEGVESQPYFDRAASLAHKLPEREAMLIEATAPALWGDVIRRLEPFTRRYPDDVEGWYQYGDALHHGGAQLLLPDDRFQTALRRATELDPAFGPAYVHLIEHAFIDEDSARVARLQARQRRIDPASRETLATDLAMRLAWGDPPELSGVPPELLREVLSPLAWTAAYWRPTLAVADELTRPGRPAPEREAGFFAKARLALYRGRLREAAEILLTPEGSIRIGSYAGEPGGPRTILITALMGLPVGEAASRAAAALPADPTPGDRFLLGARAAADGRWTDYAEQLRALEALAEAGDGLPRGEAGLPLALRGMGAAARGDRRAALRDLQAALPEVDGGCPGSRCFLHSALRFRVGEMLLRGEGDARAALPLLRSVIHHDPSATYGKLRLAQAYEALDDAAAASREYALVVRDWQDADPELQPLVEEARSALRRLEGLKRL